MLRRPSEGTTVHSESVDPRRLVITGTLDSVAQQTRDHSSQSQSHIADDHQDNENHLERRQPPPTFRGPAEIIIGGKRYYRPLHIRQRSVHNQQQLRTINLDEPEPEPTPPPQTRSQAARNRRARRGSQAHSYQPRQRQSRLDGHEHEHERLAPPHPSLLSPFAPPDPSRHRGSDIDSAQVGSRDEPRRSSQEEEQERREEKQRQELSRGSTNQSKPVSPLRVVRTYEDLFVVDRAGGYHRILEQDLEHLEADRPVEIQQVPPRGGIATPSLSVSIGSSTHDPREEENLYSQTADNEVNSDRSPYAQSENTYTDIPYITEAERAVFGDIEIPDPSSTYGDHHHLYPYSEDVDQFRNRDETDQDLPIMSNGYPPAGSQGPGAGGSGSNSVPWGGPFPSLHLWPLHDTFQMKMIHLPGGERIKIGRQTNNKTIPGERNAYFDSKVLSRTHAEIWEHNGKIFIKDVKSSNGTFINGDRLSHEGVESQPFELKSEDIVEFGIDIVSEDNRTIVHHKVAARVYCVFTSADAALSARELPHYQQDPRMRMRPNGLPVNAAPAPSSQPVLSAGGKANGLSFNHVLHRLQAELAKSKETGSALQNLTTAMTDIQDTLGGGMPPSQNGSASQFIPPQYRSAEAQAALTGSPHDQQAAAYISLQNQLTETQTSLDGHLEKIRHLEDQLREQDVVKDEISALKAQMEDGKREMELVLANARGRQMMRNFPGDVDEEHDGESDDDDARSTVTLMADDDGKQRAGSSSKVNGRPTTPEPPHLNGDTSDHGDSSSNTDGAELESRIQALTAEVAEAVAISRTLQTQHGEAMSAVKVLTDRIGSLESGIQSRVAEEVSKSEQRWESWRVKFEEGWRKERESWNAERERLRGVVREWEEASRRAHEEEEEREMNESLSEDELSPDEDLEDEEGGVDEGSREVEEGELLTLDGLEWQTSAGGTVGPRIPGGSPGGGPSGVGAGSLGRKARRRRPSHRAALAVSALKAVAGDVAGEAGSTTPRAELSTLDGESNPILGSRPDSSRGTSLGAGRGRGKSLGGGAAAATRPRGSLLARTNSNGTFRPGGSNKRSGGSARSGSGKSSSESGKDSQDTLKEDEGEGVSGGATEGGMKRRKGKAGQNDGGVQIPLFTVLVVAVVAGAIYYKQKE